METSFQSTGGLTPFIPSSYTEKWANYLNPAMVCMESIKGVYNLEIPGSATISPDQPLSDSSNLDLTRTFKPRISGPWALVTLQFEGSFSQKYLLHTLRVVTRVIPA